MSSEGHRPNHIHPKPETPILNPKLSCINLQNISLIPETPTSYTHIDPFKDHLLIPHRTLKGDLLIPHRTLKGEPTNP